MKTILFSSASQEIKDCLLQQSSYYLLELSLENLSLNQVAANESIVLVDEALFVNLSAEVKSIVLARVRSLSTILLVEQLSSQDQAKNYKQAGLHLFYFETGSAISKGNLINYLDSLFDRNILLTRLNSFIQDSFKDIVEANLLQKQKEEIEILNQKLVEISRVDHLTNLLNRRALIEAFEHEKRRAVRNRWRLVQANKYSNSKIEIEKDWAPNFNYTSTGNLSDHLGNFTCLILDIDHFKNVNDSYGHLVGDEVLRSTGALLNRPGLFRDCDTKGRYGGEEFIVLLPDTNLANSRIPAQRLQDSLAQVSFDDGKNGKFSITVSVGIAEFLSEDSSCEDVIRRADKALYYAKEHGRNQIVLYEESIDLG